MKHKFKTMTQAQRDIKEVEQLAQSILDASAEVRKLVNQGVSPDCSCELSGYLIEAENALWECVHFLRNED